MDGKGYGDFRHRRCHAQECSLQTLVADDQLAVLQVQTVQKRVQSHLRGGDVEFRQRLRQGDSVEGEVDLLLRSWVGVRFNAYASSRGFERVASLPVPRRRSTEEDAL